MKNLHIVVYVTGGIAAYKSIIFVRELIKNGAEVKVVMTKMATSFVTPLTFRTISHNEVYYDEGRQLGIVEHVELSMWADIAIIIPATANVIGKLANGIADDFATTALLAMNCPRFLVPSMNDVMYENSAMQRNLQQLENDGYKVLEPSIGFLAEGYEAKGRMQEPEVVFKWLKANILQERVQDLIGKKVIVTAGHTVEEIDPVRYITNHSTGKMGYAVAREAVKRGADVILISGPTNLANDTGAKLISIKTTGQMYQIIKKYYETSDIVIMAAAVADYHVKTPAKQKIKKNENELVLRLEKNIDILNELGKEKKQQKLVGFAAETQDLIKNAQQKLVKKNLDMIVANDVSRKDIGFGTDDNEVTFIRPNKKIISSPKTDKNDISKMIFDLI
ncbi:bifunctional phosphopantothenoylcysteine decarboxylase/phosphopantothenate--cysteine ligase CoaBC [Liquorilactobacillus cacaonum]|uniref:Coenzyme A biosynthesis bifunctional protein CoaBC n=1 Tax=Liquorilactobacillus cacaonum DSM 21116 TaxID=1423729 RepID=A0A0R2CHU3_9LACO|nr:bifunctional phosphopantothenoylcysteine decarboxylase/phosphopantothenate--cysteine ligase CoaBC [Liquorilactobacillus cacaonum]KRM90690.1 phosphopantothenoylcysteine decarboxylase phosphopantothenate-cysteine ligase [Liquorilactobacillus cacaonum DSM 21116]